MCPLESPCPLGDPAEGLASLLLMRCDLGAIIA